MGGGGGGRGGGEGGGRACAVAWREALNGLTLRYDKVSIKLVQPFRQ